MMSEQGFPGQHTTTTTVTTSTTTVQTDIRYDSTYFRTVPGVLKCVQVILNFLVFLSISVSSYAYLGRLSFLNLISGLGFWVSGLLLGCYVFHVVESFFSIPWLKIEVVYTGLWAFLLMIGSTLCVSYIAYGVIFGIVSFFGFINMIAYGYDCFLKFKSIQNGEIAQGERHVQKQTTDTTSPPAY